MQQTINTFPHDYTYKGIFNQPFVALKAGVVLFVILFVVTSAFTWLGLVALVEAGIAAHTFDYGEIAIGSFGKCGQWLVDFAIVIYSIGALLSYIIVIGSLCDQLVSSWGWQISFGIYYITAALVALFVLPNCLRRYFANLSVISVISIASVACVLFLVLIAAPIVSTTKVDRPILINPSGALEQLGSIIFTLSCSSCTFHTYNFMYPEIRCGSSWMKVCSIAVLLGLCMCMVMALMGYFMFGDATESIIINNFSGHYADPFKLLIVIHLILYIPLDFTILRHSLLKLCGISSGSLISTLLHVIFSVAILAAVTAATLLLYSAGLTSGAAFSLVLNLAGGIAGSLTSFALPAAFYLANMPPSASLHSFCWLMLVVGIVLVVLVPYSVLVQY